MSKEKSKQLTFSFTEREAGKGKPSYRILQLEIEEKRATTINYNCKNCNIPIFTNEKVFQLTPPNNRKDFCYLCGECFELFSKNEITIYPRQ